MPNRSWIDQVGLIAERGREILNLRSNGRRASNAESLCLRLMAQRGEASALALASEVVSAIAVMDEAETAAFLDMLAVRFSPDPDRVDEAVRSWQERRDGQALKLLTAAVEAPRQDLFRRLNAAPDGTRALVDLRARLLDALPGNPGLGTVDADLRHLFSSWFNRGFLTMEQISWHSPAVVLERLIQYEAVHEIRGWEDLSRRLAADRRCFAFFHPALPDEPLIFVEVALTRGLAGSIAPLIDVEREIADPDAADTAIFFSISNCQRGLRSVSFGSFLIKQVVAELSTQLPGLKRFATLSPLPRLNRYLAQRQDQEGFTETRLRALIEADNDALCKEAETADPLDALDLLRARPEPHSPAMRRVLERLTLAYLAFVRRRGGAADPVAHFHLSNGARLERIDLDADLSPKGVQESSGVMVNYLYDPEQVEVNHERYAEDGEVVMVRGLATRARRLRGTWG